MSVLNINVAMERLTPSSTSSDDYDYNQSQLIPNSSFKVEIPSSVMDMENPGNGYAMVNNNGIIQFDQQQWYTPNFNPKLLTPLTPPSNSPTNITKRVRTQFSSHQLVALEREFQTGKYLCRTRRISMAQSLNLSEKQIKVWFQNRRMKAKKDGKSKAPREPAQNVPEPVYQPPTYSHSEPQYVPQGFTVPFYPDGSFRSDDYYQVPDMRSCEVWSSGTDIDNGGLTHL